MELIAQAANAAVFQAAANATGFLSNGHIITTGTWTDREGSWALNVVGTVHYPTGNTVEITGPANTTITVPEMAEANGYWARLRWNGDTTGRLPTFLGAIQSFGITVYTYQSNGMSNGIWSSDGLTPAPDWVKDVGVIL